MAHQSPRGAISAQARLLFFAMALAGGAVLPIQGRINSELSDDVADPVFAALISFSAGLILMGVLALTPWGVNSLRKVPAVLRSGDVRAWYLVAGCIGAYLALSQTLSIGAIGVAIFTVAVVTGQVMGGLVADRLGLTTAGRQRMSPTRLLGAALAVVSVLAVVWPQLSAPGRDWLWLLLVLVPLVGGLGNSVQQVLNGKQTAGYGSALPVTLFNYASGTLLLLVIYGVKVVAGGPAEGLPTTWWYYIGGPLGCIFIGFTALLVPRVGALLTTLGIVAGQLLGSLLVDLLAPASGSMVTPLTLAGTVLALAAVVIVSRGSAQRPRTNGVQASGQG